MTQNRDVLRSIAPGAAVSSAVARLRKRQGWTADDLATECARLGMPSLNRSVIANIESGRRKSVTVDELCCLAFALDVAPIHLLVPMGDDPKDPDLYEAAPDALLTLEQARLWIRGELVPPGRDPRLYYANVPAEEFEAIKASDRGKNLRDLGHQLRARSRSGTTMSGRPPLRIGAHGKIKRTNLGGGVWLARCRFRDSDGVTRPVERRSPEGAYDQRGQLAEDELLSALEKRRAPGNDDEVTGRRPYRCCAPSTSRT